MTSKVIIRIGEQSDQVERDALEHTENYVYASDLTVMFATVGVYYVIITDRTILSDIHSLIVSDRIDEADQVVRQVVTNYAMNNFDEFSARIDKAIRTAHGVGVKKTTQKLLNAANPNRHRSNPRRNTRNDTPNV